MACVVCSIEPSYVLCSSCSFSAFYSVPCLPPSHVVLPLTGFLLDGILCSLWSLMSSTPSHQGILGIAMIFQ